MKKTRNVVFVFIAAALLLLPALTVAAEEELTIAAVLPLTGPFGPAGLLGADAGKGTPWQSLTRRVESTARSSGM